MDAVKSPLRKNRDHIPRPREIGDFFRNRRGIGFVTGNFSGSGDVGDNAFGVEALLRRNLLEASDARDENTVGLRESRRKFFLENIPAGGI